MPSKPGELSSSSAAYYLNNIGAVGNATSNNRIAAGSTTTFSPVVLKSDRFDAYSNATQFKNDLNLGRLDGLVSSPHRSTRVRVTDSKKFAAILLETNIVELQRHLLTITVQNQVRHFYIFLIVKYKF